MNIVVCFIGLIRTISETYQNLKQNIYNNSDTFTTIFVTWESENVDEFKKYFPTANIYKIPNIYINDIDFDKWCKNTTMHSSWINTYSNNKNALFNYYRQIYLWNQSAIILESFNDIDIIIRARTDIIINGDYVKNYYDRINSLNIFFPNEPKQTGCPDQLFFGRPNTVIKLLKIIDNVNYIYNKYNISMNPERFLYYMVENNNLELNYMSNSLEIIHNNIPKIHIWERENNDLSIFR
jgi:hypothetical protein